MPRFKSSPYSNIQIKYGVFDNLGEGVLLVGASHECLYLNKLASRQIQKTQEALVGKKAVQLLAGIHEKELDRKVDQCLKDGEPIQMVRELYFPDGSAGWFDTRMERTPEGILIRWFDITSQKKTENELRSLSLALEEHIKLKKERLMRLTKEAEEKIAEYTMLIDARSKDLDNYKMALDTSCIITVTDKQGTILHVNDNFLRISKYSREEVIGQNHRIVNSGYHSKEFFRDLWKTISQGKIWKGTIRNRAKDGTIYWVDTVIFPFLDEKGAPQQYLAIRSDVTEKVIAEERLKTSEEKYRDLFANAIVPIITTDMTTLNPVMVNDVGARLFGYKSVEDFLHHFNTTDHFIRPRERSSNIEQASKYGELTRVQEMKRLDGSRFWALIFVRTNPRSKVAQTLVLDITKEIEAQRKLTARLKELKNANKELEAFTYIASHDLQEPLRKVRNFVDVLGHTRRKRTHKEQYCLDGLYETSRQMQALISDLLAYTRTRSGIRNFEEVNLNDLVAEVLADFKQTIKEKKAIVRVGKLCAPTVIRFQVRQLLNNLFSNSLKFTDPHRIPEITISSEMAPGAKLSSKLKPRTNYCHIVFRDNGIGFSAEYNRRVFEIFERLNSQEKYPGTGIGLAICKRIVENHKGVIRASGELNKGAQFDIFLPEA